MKIALIGLGKMGSVLAKRLLSAGFDLTVYNRTAEKMKPLVDAGAKGAASLKDAVKNQQIIITCLLDDNAVMQTSHEFVQAMESQAIHLGTSTILPDTSKTLLDLHQKNGSIYVAGNVLGVPKAAEKGELTSIVAGDHHAINTCQSIFKAYSSKIIPVGEKPYQANVVKICMNYFLISAIETMGEIYTFAEKSEVDTDIINTLFHAIFSHPAFKLYVDKIKERHFEEVNFDMKGGLKDLSLFQQAFTNVRVVPDIANIIKNKFIIASANHMDDLDWSAVTDITRRQAGLE